LFGFGFGFDHVDADPAQLMWFSSWCGFGFRISGSRVQEVDPDPANDAGIWIRLFNTSFIVR